MGYDIDMGYDMVGPLFCGSDLQKLVVVYFELRFKEIF